MREIKFRGKRIDNNEWVYGYLQKQAVEGEEYYITWPCTELINNCRVVIPKTIGQFTGLYDKKNVPIYEGDILENTAVNFKFIVKFIKTKWALQKLEFPEDSLDMYDFFHRIPTMFEVIGNIYDNEVEE